MQLVAVGAVAGLLAARLGAQAFPLRLVDGLTQGELLAASDLAVPSP